jgi:hypothetical protein
VCARFEQRGLDAHQPAVDFLVDRCRIAEIERHRLIFFRDLAIDRFAQHHAARFPAGKSHRLDPIARHQRHRQAAEHQQSFRPILEMNETARHMAEHDA